MAQATHKVSWATRPGLDEVLSLSEEPDASSYDADAELEKLLPIAERISQCKEEALKGVLDPDLADLCLAAALLISRVDCLRPSEEGLVALKRMFTEASLGPLADWALEMKVQYSEAIPCETAASIFALQLRLVQVWANGGTLGFLGWPWRPVRRGARANTTLDERIHATDDHVLGLSGRRRHRVSSRQPPPRNACDRAGRGEALDLAESRDSLRRLLLLPAQQHDSAQLRAQRPRDVGANGLPCARSARG
jgi:hypothetical protein